MFSPNLKVGLINIYHSLLEGGHFATAVWASPEKVPFIFVPMNTVLKETNNPPPLPGTPGPFSLSDENILKNYFLTSGSNDLIVERMNVTFKFGSPEAYTIFTNDHGGPVLQKMLASQTIEKREIE
jgi:hypothetical protein